MRWRHDGCDARSASRSVRRSFLESLNNDSGPAPRIPALSRSGRAAWPAGRGRNPDRHDDWNKTLVELDFDFVDPSWHVPRKRLRQVERARSTQASATQSRRRDGLSDRPRFEGERCRLYSLLDMARRRLQRFPGRADSPKGRSNAKRGGGFSWRSPLLDPAKTAAFARRSLRAVTKPSRPARHTTSLRAHAGELDGFLDRRPSWLSVAPAVERYASRDRPPRCPTRACQRVRRELIAPARKADD